MEKYGWFSEESARQYGTMYFHTPDGGEVEVTHISGFETPEEGGVFVGVVTTYSRMGREPAWVTTVGDDITERKLEEDWDSLACGRDPYGDDGY